jgi:DNA-binding response OmpR family regulator
MRVVIVDSDTRAGRKVAAALEALVPSVDVLLYDDVDSVLSGMTDQSADVVIVAPDVAGVPGPDVMRRVVALDLDATLVGVVPEPDRSWSERYIDAGAGLVVARPLDKGSLRVALRQRAGGIT